LTSSVGFRQLKTCTVSHILHSSAVSRLIWVARGERGQDERPRIRETALSTTQESLASDVKQHFPRVEQEMVHALAPSASGLETQELHRSASQTSAARKQTDTDTLHAPETGRYIIEHRPVGRLPGGQPTPSHENGSLLLLHQATRRSVSFQSLDFSGNTIRPQPAGNAGR
jgi:hypothetical protein